MNLRQFFLAVLTALAWFLSSPASAADRVALIIGIDDYDNVPKLAKATGDAKAVGARLEQLGFEVTTLLNGNRREIAQNLSELRAKAEDATTVLVHFSGHGVAAGGENFLLPKDVSAPGMDPHLMEYEAISQSQLIDTLAPREGQNRQLILIVDACRDNPYAKSTRSFGTERGLARIEPPRGVFIMYSAGFGETALDSLGEKDAEPTSVYTRVLLQQLARPGANLIDIANDTRAAVASLASRIGHQQNPASYDQVDGRKVVLFPGIKTGEPEQKPTESQPAADDGEAVKAAFDVARQIGTPAALEAFVEEYPGTFYAKLALTMLAPEPKKDEPEPEKRNVVEETDPIETCSPVRGNWFVTGVASNDTLNARSGPGVNYSVVMRLAPDTRGLVRGACSGDGRWCRITFDCRTAWVSARFISSGETDTRPRFYRVVGVASNDTLRIRSGPGSSEAEIAAIPPGGRSITLSRCVKVPGYVANWCRISWQGVEGWAYAKYLAPQ